MLDRKTRVSCLLVPAVLAAGSVAMAQEAIQPIDDKISGSVGVDYSSHFVSYGADVWGGGNDMFSGDSTVFVWGEIGIELPHNFGATIGVWSDINDNGGDPLGGRIQEVDVYAGLSYSFDKFTVGATYQEWYYSGDEERIVDLSASYDDTGLIWDDFGFNPSVVWHIRVDGNGGQEEGSAIVASIEPAFELTKSEDYPLTLSIPAGVAFFLDDDFQGGDQEGYAYSYIGATLSVPLSFIPEGYGAWSLAGNVTYYMTDDDALPGNEDDDFLTGMLSLSMSF